MEDTEDFDKMTTEAYNAMTSHGDIPLTCHIYKLSFLNFLLGKQPNGPGQFMFGLVGSYNMKKFSIDIEDGEELSMVIGVCIPDIWLVKATELWDGLDLP